MNKIRLVFLSDIHAGSVYALASPKYIPENRNNPFMKWIFDCWSDFCNKYNNPDYLMLLGDLADGPQVKTLGVDAITTDTDEQVDMVTDLLSMIIGDKTKIYGIHGSGYHGGLGQATNIDRRIIEKLGGEFKGGVFEFDIGNEKIQICHGGSSAINTVHAYITREITLANSNSHKLKTKGPTILVRGHQHRFYTVQDDSGVYGILNGCWQYTTPYMLRKSANITPSIGAVIIDIEDDIAKIYRQEYIIPEDVREYMTGYKELLSERTKENKKEENEKWKETLKEIQR